MAELSEVRDRVRQIINDALAHANKVGRMVYAGDNVVDPVIKAAQLPWEPPMAGEINAIFGAMLATDASTFGVACEFVRRRNAAIQPKLVDPRVDEIALIICQSRDAGLSIQQTAAKIAALDEVK